MNAWTTLRSIPTMLALMVRVPAWAVKYSLSYKRARRMFKHHLIEQGVPRDEAADLARLYPFKMSDFLESARGFN